MDKIVFCDQGEIPFVEIAKWILFESVWTTD